MNKYLDSLVTAVWIYDIDNYCMLWANQSALKLWESESLEELKSRDYKPGSSSAVQQTLRDCQKIFNSGKSISRIWQYSPKGIKKEAYCQMSGYTLEDGRTALLTEAIDMSLINGKFGSNAIISLSTYSPTGEFISGNPPFLKTQNNSYSHLKMLFSDPRDFKRIQNVLKIEQKFEDDILININQKPKWHRLLVSYSDEQESFGNILVQQFNIDERKREQLALEKKVITDPLTGLFNRRGLNNILQDAIKEQQSFVIFYLDLDGFKLINDSLGHAVGDDVLQGLGSRLTSKDFEKGFACRFGGDEFVWVINESMLDKSVVDTANQLINTMNKPFYDKQDRPIIVSASVGIAHYPKDGTDFSNLILKADAAMYLAKKQGKHRWVNYISGMENTLQRQSKLAQYLFYALERDEFSLFYQPIFDVKSRSIHSFEALLRWNSKEIGSVPTDECIRVAEEIGIIIDIEKWVIATAIKDLLQLRSIYHDDLSMAINVSSKYFADPEFVNFIIAQLNQNNLPSSAINIELTEGTLLLDVNRNDNAALKIDQQNIPISIDDFGTGYSSLAYLHQIPASIVKIDQSFTNRVEADSTMIESIQFLIKSLGFTTIVEGVENNNQSDLLLELGINLQQGFGLGMPQPLEFYLDKTNRVGLLSNN